MPVPIPHFIAAISDHLVVSFLPYAVNLIAYEIEQLFRAQSERFRAIHQPECRASQRLVDDVVPELIFYGKPFFLAEY